MSLRRNSKIMTRGILRANTLEAERDENLEKRELPTQRERRVLRFYANGKNTDRGANLSVERDTAFSRIVVSSGSRGSVQAQNRKVYPFPSPLFLWHLFHPRWKSSWKGAWSGLYREAEVHWIVLVCPSWDTLSFSYSAFCPLRPSWLDSISELFCLLFPVGFGSWWSPAGCHRAVGKSYGVFLPSFSMAHRYALAMSLCDALSVVGLAGFWPDVSSE